MYAQRTCVDPMKKAKKKILNNNQMDECSAVSTWLIKEKKRKNERAHNIYDNKNMRKCRYVHGEKLQNS